MTNHRLDSLITPHIERLKAIRHDIHAHPELGYEEVRTSGLVVDTLKEFGYESSRPIETGVISDTGSGNALAFRADMDCLPLTEENDVPYKSTVEGLMHACGHDGHTTILLGMAMALSGVRDRLPGNVRFLFQPAEEGGGGADRMIQGNALDGVDKIFGLHNWPTLTRGTLATKSGPLMACVATFDVVVRGRGGHASQPAMSIDPVLTACQCVTELQSIISRETDFSTPAVLSVTKIQAGTASNIIPDFATFGGTIRAWGDEQSDTIGRRIEEVCAAISKAHECTASTEYKRYYPVTCNHPEETALVQGVGREIYGDANVTDDGLPMMGAEDFSFYLQKRPGCFFFLGGGAEGRTNSMCHSTTFDFNDDLILDGVRMFLRILERHYNCELV